MTVIACRDGVMAADSVSWHGNVCVGPIKKIHRLSDGSLAGFAGWMPAILTAIRWLNDGAHVGNRPPAADEGDLEGIILRTDRSVHRLSFRYDVWPTEAVAAIGAHTEFLLGAMFSGASAKTAVELAIRHCCFAKGEAVSIQL